MGLIAASILFCIAHARDGSMTQSGFECADPTSRRADVAKDAASESPMLYAQNEVENQPRHAPFAGQKI
jgi:hypothetical protein